MPKSNVKKAERESLNLKDEQFQRLKSIFPEVIADGKVNWDKLRTILGDSIDVSFEKFSFSWAGKSQAIKNVLIPSKATLRPDKKESIKFDESEHIFIEGDNLEVLKLLQNSYFEKIKMIYIDPPYNTGNDFVYKDDFKNSLKNYHEQTGQTDNAGNKLQTNTESNGRFHSDWLNMMYPRIKLAWNLLKDDGVIFISIDDNEQHHLRMMMDEIFGEENFVADFIWKKKGTSTNVKNTQVSPIGDYLLCYKKNEQGKLIPRITHKETRSYPYKDNLGEYRTTIIEKKDAGSYARKTMKFKILGKKPRIGKRWQIGETEARRLEQLDRFLIEDGVVKLKIYSFEDEDTISAWSNFIEDCGSSDSAAKMLNEQIFNSPELFDNPKPVELVKRIITFSTNANCEDLILDFFAGSGTTAHAVLTQNQEDGGKRKFICVQIPEPVDVKSEAYQAGYKTIAEITKERIRRVIKGYGDHPSPIDDGFKIFKLAASNYPENQFEYNPENSAEENKKSFKAYLEKSSQQDLFKKINESDLIYENIIKEGLSLNSKITEIKIGKNKIFHVNDDKAEFFICLDPKITEAAISELRTSAYKNKIFIALDSALEDSSKANLGLHLSLKTI